jgi:subtilisin family serine protease
MKTFSATLVTIFAVLVFITSGVAQAQVLEGTDHPSFLGYVPDRIVVEFDERLVQGFKPEQLLKGRTGIGVLDQLCRRHGVSLLRKQFSGARKKWYRGRQLNLAHWHKIQFQREVEVEKVVAEFKKMDGVLDAQPIGIHAVALIPNDFWFPDHWHLNQLGDHDIDAPEAWGIETGKAEIVVAVLDTGVRWFHKDLGGGNAGYFEPPGFDDTIDGLHGAEGNLWTNPAELNGSPGFDDDGNGYTDDMIGWDFVNFSLICWLEEDCFFEDNDPRDFHGHGTHVAGIIAALNNNGYAGSSTAGGWGNGTLQPSGSGVRIMPLRIGYAHVSSPQVGVVQMDLAAEAFRYAADQGARLANASWGSSNTGGLAAAIDYFIDRGGLIFKAAGNDDNDTADYMGQRADIVKVAATGQRGVDAVDQDDCKADFSSFGTWVDIAAPGSDIFSTWHEYTDPANDYIAALSGTSMASPLALSVAALIWSQNLSWSAEMVRRQLFNSADPIDFSGCTADFTDLLGAGRVNAFNAVSNCPGDINGDGDSDGGDLAHFASIFESGTADEIDLALFASNLGRANCP